MVVHEGWGLNDDVRRMTERFAAAGYLALAIDIYGVPATTDPAEAARRAQAFQTPDAMDLIAGAARWLASHPRGSGKAGVTGFCLGGAMALVAACQVEGLTASVPFYGTGMDKYLDFTRTKVPIVGHYVRHDPFVDPVRAEAIHARALREGARFEIHFYEANHAFMRESDPHAYDAAAAKLAWERTMAFLAAELGPSAA